MILNFKKFLPILIPVILLISFSLFLQYTFVSNPERIKTFLSSFGPYYVLGYIVIQFAAIVIPPIPGSIVALTTLAILGPLQGSLLIYLVTTPAECINFWLSKKYGRKLAQKVIGEKSMEKVDYVTKDAGKETLIVLKFFEDSFFDYISYGLGLTQITLKQFVIANFGVGAVNALIKYLILTHAPNFISSIIILEMVSGVLTYFYILHKKRGRKKQIPVVTFEEL